jgi:hypothetical protein
MGNASVEQRAARVEEERRRKSDEIEGLRDQKIKGRKVNRLRLKLELTRGRQREA